MKKSIKLSVELILAIVISLTIGFISALVFNSFYRNLTLNDEKIKNIAIEKNKDILAKIEKEFNIESGDEELVFEIMKTLEEKFGNILNNKFYLVDKEGEVKFKIGNLPIVKFDLKEIENEEIIVNEYFFSITNSIEINENNYLLCKVEGSPYNDRDIFIVGIIISITIFLLLIRGRVLYIEKMAKDVRELAKGNLSNRIELKYKNQLTNLAEDINHMAKELKEQEDSQKEFITNISHDLRTPLTTIMGYCTMIESKLYKDEEELKKYIKIIDRKVNYLKVIIEDFFQYSKLLSKDIILKEEQINLSELLLEILEGEEVFFKERNLALEIEFEEKSIEILGDRRFIERAFNNLINNARKHSKENNKVKIIFKKEIINNKAFAVFIIENKVKKKLSEEDKEKIFKRLYKVDKARTEEGSGLGLAITKEIIKIHEGDLNLSIDSDKIAFKVILTSK